MRHEVPSTARPKILAEQYLPPRDSSRSCPDLSALRISAEQSQSDVINAPANGLYPEINTEPSRASTPGFANKPRKPRKLASTRRQVSKGARDVLGKVRSFHKVAAAKMAHPTIKIDTTIQATKRGPPVGEEEVLETVDDQGNPGLDEGDKDNVPPFLCQSAIEIHRKFEDLEWMQRARIAEGTLANDPSHRWALEVDPEVKARNRYTGVQAWANSRIHLKVPEGECDFINASPIVMRDSMTQEERRYIATQGPKSGHLAHFWHMVFHESTDVGVVVMLTQTFESGREKCAQYFPLDTDEPSMHLYANQKDPYVNDGGHQGPNADNVLGTVKLLECSFDEKSRSEVRKLELTLGSESKIVWHFLFAGWADFAKPEGEDREALLELINLSASKCTFNNPRVVHCSAGVGRTGTFIALDHLLRELESGYLLTISDEEDDPVFETVDIMREQRMMMVYNEIQLQFIYEVLREQVDKKLGKTVTKDPGDMSNGDRQRSTKMAKLSNDFDFLPSPDLSLEHDTDRVTTPLRSWSGTPEVSKNE